jgi:hypothetical protein
MKFTKISMVVLRRLIALSAVLLAPVFLAAEPQSQPHGDGPTTWAGRAKAKGQTEVTIRTFADESEGFSLGEMFDCFAVVLGQPVFQITLPDDHDVRTWYTFRVSETISRPRKHCATKPTLPEVPSIVPQGGGQVVVAVIGGQAEINGVRVNQLCAESPQFKGGGTYVLFLDFTSDSTAVIGAHGSGAYEVGEDGRLHGTISKTSPLKTRILALQSLRNLRREIASPAVR